MDPIPLRTLALLLNYERMASDPRFKNLGLQYSSAANDYVKKIKDFQWPTFSKNEPASLEHTWLHQFTFMEIKEEANPATVTILHPKAFPHAKQQGYAEREGIYHHTRGSREGFNSACLFQYFFDLCPPGQQLAIQFEGEKPVYIPAATPSRRYMKFLIHNPRTSYFITDVRKILSATGKDNDEKHFVLAFPHPEEPDNPDRSIVIDLSRLQFGKNGRGSWGENYYFNTFAKYKQSMRRICERLDQQPDLQGRLCNSPNEERLRGCALKVWERWANREVEGWCAWCGRGGKDLRSCSSCKKANRKVLYCSRDHEKLDSHLHKHTCAKK